MIFDKIFNKTEVEEAIKPKPIIPRSLEHVLNSVGERTVQGVDSEKIALISVRRKDNSYMVGIQFEKKVGSEIFTERHDTVVDSVEEAARFFSDFKLGKIFWLKASPSV